MAETVFKYVNRHEVGIICELNKHGSISDIIYNNVIVHADKTFASHVSWKLKYVSIVSLSLHV